jgi:hypothetical protein
VKNIEMAHEDSLEDKEIEEHHSDAMTMDFEEELRFWEEWIAKTKIDEDCITVA